MGKTTNILDLNNRLTKVEKENVTQNSYTSLKNKPKINNVTLTGNKSSSDLGLAAASDLATLTGDVGDKANLTTTYKDDLVGSINEVNDGLTKVVTLIDNINMNTHSGSLYRSSSIPITCDSEPTDVVVSVTRSSGAVIGAMVHSISGTTVNVIVWATEEIQESIKIVLFYR